MRMVTVVLLLGALFGAPATAYAAPVPVSASHVQAKSSSGGIGKSRWGGSRRSGSYHHSYGYSTSGGGSNGTGSRSGSSSWAPIAFVGGIIALLAVVLGLHKLRRKDD